MEQARLQRLAAKGRGKHKGKGKVQPSVARYTGTQSTCSICLEFFSDGDSTCRLSCRHLFHEDCWRNAILSAGDDGDQDCPNCRGSGQVIAYFPYIGATPSAQDIPASPPAATDFPNTAANAAWSDGSSAHGHQPSTAAESVHPTARSLSIRSGQLPASPQRSVRPSSARSDQLSASPQRYSIADDPDDDIENPNAAPSADVEQAFPWWQVQSPLPMPCEDSTVSLYHFNTRIPGRFSLILDTGAYTNILGGKWCRGVSSLAAQYGHPSSQSKRDQPLYIQGVGHGSQACNWNSKTPLAIKDSTGRVQLHHFEGPVVEGPTGEDLPALWGWSSMCSQGVLIETTPKQITIPGPGGYTINWAPGAITFPLSEAPSGHPVLLADHFEEYAKQAKSGISPDQLTFHASPSTPPSTSTSATSAPSPSTPPS